MELRPAIAIVLIAVGFVTSSQADEKVPDVVVDRADSEIFPEIWRKEPVSAKAEVLSEGDRVACRELVERELAKYPAGMLQNHLKRIHVLARLEYRGVATGGTRSASVVYVVRNSRISPGLLANNLHAEFSSILLRNHPEAIDEEAWRALNPADFEYRGSGVQAVKNGQASIKPRDELHAEGFLNEYAKASFEEDFNSFAGRLLTGDPQLWRAIGKFPGIAAKADLAIAFYGALDPAFTRGFFEGLRREG